MATLTKLQATVDTLTALQERKLSESIRLANAMWKIENRSLSKIYKELSNPSEALKPLINEVLGKSKMPDFKTFAAKAGEKESWSVYGGLQVLGKFNREADAAQKLITKLKKQDANKKAANATMSTKGKAKATKAPKAPKLVVEPKAA